VKGTGVEARAKGPFLKWQNCSSKAAKALGEREELRPPPPSLSGKEGAADKWQL